MHLYVMLPMFLITGSLLFLHYLVQSGKILLSQKRLTQFKRLPWDIIRVFLFIGFLVSGAWLTMRFVIQDARADWPFEESPVFFVGAQYEMGERDSVFCHARSANWVGNVGIEQTVFKGDQIEIDLNYTHHSCAFEEDDLQDYDGVGASFRVKLWK